MGGKKWQRPDREGSTIMVGEAHREGQVVIGNKARGSIIWLMMRTMTKV
jgi:hypothetical protein